MKCKSNTNAGLWQVRVIEIKACMLQLMDLYPVAITNVTDRPNGATHVRLNGATFRV